MGMNNPFEFWTEQSKEFSRAHGEIDPVNDVDLLSVRLKLLPQRFYVEHSNILALAPERRRSFVELNRPPAIYP